MQFPSFVDELPITRDALEFAAARHTGQRRSGDQAPFILHPLEVAHLLRGRDYPDEVVAAGVLHDVIEDAGVSREELTERFGARVTELVRAVSEPSSEGSYGERKARLREAVSQAQPDAVAIYAADKVAKLRELRMVIATTRDYEPDLEQLEHYWASLELLEERAPANPARPSAAVRARGPGRATPGAGLTSHYHKRGARGLRAFTAVQPAPRSPACDGSPRAEWAFRRSDRGSTRRPAPPARDPAAAGSACGSRRGRAGRRWCAARASGRRACGR